MSGCLGLDKDTMKLVEGDVSCETRQALRNLGFILQAAESSYDKVIKTTIYMSDMNDFTAINEVYKECEYVYNFLSNLTKITSHKSLKSGSKILIK